MTLITPSEWLKKLVQKSILRKYPVEVCYNKIDESIFKPTPSDFRKKYSLEEKFVILGVASSWDDRKGLDDFLELAQMLDDRFCIVLVGLTQKQIKKIPRKIKCVLRTNDTHELAGLYTSADLFVNPSKEETYGMTTVETRACGTEAMVYSDTACEEIAKKIGGIVVQAGVDNLYREIIRYANCHSHNRENRDTLIHMHE